MLAGSVFRLSCMNSLILTTLETHATVSSLICQIRKVTHPQANTSPSFTQFQVPRRDLNSEAGCCQAASMDSKAAGRSRNTTNWKKLSRAACHVSLYPHSIAHLSFRAIRWEH